jgi:hypothetical protein
MREATIKVYKFDDLSDNAKVAAKQKYAELFGYVFADEALASLKTLAERFNGKLTNYSIDWCNSSYSSATFDMPETEEGEIAATLAELGTYNPETLKGNGDCVLTGYCADEDAIDGLQQAWHNGERDLDTLMQAAFKTWLKAAQGDNEAFYEDDEFSEHSDANEYEYYQDGSIYDGPGGFSEHS